MASQDKATNRTKRIFGGKKNLKLRAQNKISNQQWKDLRLLPLPIIGEACKSGNRKFNFQIIDLNQLIFKINKNTHIELKLPKLRKNIQKTLFQLECAANSDRLPISIKIDQSFIYIAYDELKLNEINKIESRKERYAGIDLNPNYIGVSISENGEVLSTSLFDLKELTRKSDEASSHWKSIYKNNKLDFETIQIANKISKELAYLKVGVLSLEDLKFKQGNSGKGKSFNRTTHNVWKRNLFINQLVKRCKILGIEVIFINPAYTSIIGNLQHEYPDPISASLEISRRGYETKERKSDKFYPIIKIKEVLVNLWKKELGLEDFNFGSWKEVWNLIKNSKLKYRVPIPAVGFRKLSSIKSLVSYNNYKLIQKDT